MKSKKGDIVRSGGHGYEAVLSDVVRLIQAGRSTAARSVNAVMTATYWGIGRRIVEHEQGGAHRAAYGEALLKRLASDLTARLGRGFSERNLEQMRLFFLTWPISQTTSAESLPEFDRAHRISQATSAISSSALSPAPLPAFPLPWSHYVRLLGVANPEARRFYEVEALRGGWTARQLNRQIGTQFYERTALSRNKAAMLHKGQAATPDDSVTPEEALKDPYLLEFLDLKDEYSETELEAALIAKLESFLLELGGDFTFVGRQRRLRVGDEWYRIDLLFFHRQLRCLVIIDLKLGRFTHADAGQMHLYLNYAREHWTLPGENPPVGLILCAEKDSAVAKYALEGLPNKVLAAEYRTALPEERVLADQIERTRRTLEVRIRSARSREQK
ncbi:MAG: PDDEXK nuclease domain-containing protein [Polyangia bacterium]|jgi:predicted nuclease of restriction endonuclease-like (RecB) superfamily